MVKSSSFYATFIKNYLNKKIKKHPKSSYENNHNKLTGVDIKGFKEK